MCLNHTTIFKDLKLFFRLNFNILFYDINRQSIEFSFFLTSTPSPVLSALPGPPPSDLAMPSNKIENGARKGLHELPFE